MKYEYPITADYIPNWDLRRALREVVTNAMDAERELRAPFTRSYDAKKKRLVLTNTGAKLPSDAKLFGFSTKRDRSDLIGQHGEGLKLALLVLTREGLVARVRNGADETWSASINYSEKWGARVFTLEVTAAKRQVANVEVEVAGVEPELWQEVEDAFLAFRDADRVALPGGDVLLSADLCGKLFVKGVFTTYMPDLSWGFNFNNLHLNRDRDTPSDWDCRWEMAQLMAQWLEQDRATSAPRLYELFAKERPEVRSYGEYNQPPSHMVEALVGVFRAEHGEDVLPVVSTGEALELEHLGRRGVVVSKTLARALTQWLPTLDRLRDQLKNEVTARHAPGDLTERERRSYQRALRVLVEATDLRDVAARTSVVDFRSPEIEGLHKGDEILVARRALTSVGAALMVLIHAFAHDLGGDGEKGHVDAMHRLSVRVFEHFTKEEA